MNQAGKVRVAGISIAIAVLVFGFLGGYKILNAQSAMAPGVLEAVQYQFEGGQGTLRLGAEDVIMDLGMITGVKEAGSPEWKELPTATILLEMNSRRKGVTWQLDSFRFIERVNGKDKRVFKPTQIYDSESQKGRTSAIQFLEKNKDAILSWDTARRCYLYLVFSELPADVVSGDLVLIYQCKFPDKKYLSYYEDRFTLKQKVYPR